MTDHTPEPWYTEERGIIGSRHPEWRQLWTINLGDSGRHFTRELDEANARRVVACINALEGAATEDLEQAVALGITDVFMGNLFSSRLKLKKQLDEVQSLVSDLTHTLAKRDTLIAFTIKECSEPEALDDLTTNCIGQLATSIRDLRADFEEKLAAKDEELAYMEDKLRALLPHSNVFLFGKAPQE